MPELGADSVPSRDIVCVCYFPVVQRSRCRSSCWTQVQ